MLACLFSAAVVGIDAYPVHIEVDVSHGLPSFTMVVGELSLDGGINSIRGVLPIAMAARRRGIRRLLIPPSNAAEACIVDSLDVCTVRSLAEAVHALNHPESATILARNSTTVP